MKIRFYILLMCLGSILSGCGEEFNNRIGEQDKVFINKIKTYLKKKGDIVRVSDIYPGDWEAVCINPISAYSSIEVKYIKGVGPRPNGIEIINNPISTYANDQVWGIYFTYPGNRAEYYRIPIEEMQGHLGGISPYSDKYDPRINCIPKEGALMKVVDDANEWNKRLQAAKEAGTWNGMSVENNSNYIKLLIATEEEDQ